MDVGQKKNLSKAGQLIVSHSRVWEDEANKHVCWGEGKLFCCASFYVVYFLLDRNFLWHKDLFIVRSGHLLTKMLCMQFSQTQDTEHKPRELMFCQEAYFTIQNARQLSELARGILFTLWNVQEVPKVI